MKRTDFVKMDGFAIKNGHKKKKPGHHSYPWNLKFDKLHSEWAECRFCVITLDMTRRREEVLVTVQGGSMFSSPYPAPRFFRAAFFTVVFFIAVFITSTCIVNHVLC